MAKEKKKTILKGIGLGIYFAIAIHLLNGVLSMMLDEEDFLPYIVSPDRIIASILGGCFFWRYDVSCVAVKVEKNRRIVKNI